VCLGAYYFYILSVFFLREGGVESMCKGEVLCVPGCLLSIYIKREMESLYI